MIDVTLMEHEAKLLKAEALRCLKAYAGFVARNPGDFTLRSKMDRWGELYIQVSGKLIGGEEGLLRAQKYASGIVSGAFAREKKRRAGASK